MKKVLLILLVLLFCLSAIGCNKTKIPSYPDFISDHSIRGTGFRKEYNDYIDIEKDFNKFYVSKDAPDFEVSDYKNGVCINRYNGDEDVVKIPETIGGKPVIKLGMYCVFITNISDDDYYCLDYSCPFMNNDLYSDLINDYTKYNNQLKLYEYHEGEAHFWCEGVNNVHLVKKIIIPKTVKYIGNVDSYTVTFEVDKDNPNFSSINGSLCSKDGKEFYRYNFNEKTVKIPEGIITVYNGSLPKKKVYIPASVENFYNYDTFKSCVVDENNKVYSSSEKGALLTKDGKELIPFDCSVGKDANIIDFSSVEEYYF